MTDRSAYLSRLTAEHIAHLCELNHIDTNAVKTKQERISCLCDLPKLVEDEPKNTSVGVDDFLRVMKHLEDSHHHETEKLCKSLLSAAIGSSAQTGPPLKGLHQLVASQCDAAANKGNRTLGIKAVHNSVMKYPSTLPGSQANTRIFGRHVFL